MHKISERINKKLVALLPPDKENEESEGQKWERDFSMYSVLCLLNFNFFN